MKLVVKVGTAILSKKKGGLNAASLKALVAQLAALHKKKHQVVLVSSGAIAAGVGRLRLSGKPKDLGLKQATAAVGQLTLMEAYESAFKKYRITPAQILLTRDDLTHKERTQNARKTLDVLLKLKTIPIINENDTVATEEIKFGDNDSLSAFVADTVKADKLILLSDVDGLFELDKKGNVTKKQIYKVSNVAAVEKQVSKVNGSKLSTGGMAAKLMAAKRATAAGIETWIASGRKPNILSKILSGVPNVATRFLARGR
jgi:glutamate 5-kinase